MPECAQIRLSANGFLADHCLLPAFKLDDLDRAPTLGSADEVGELAAQEVDSLL